MAYRLESTMDPQRVHETVENWRMKSSSLAVTSNDVVIPVISRTFETIGTVMRHDADPNLIKRSLWSLSTELNISMQYDSYFNEPIRNLTYDLLDSVHLILTELDACRSRHAIFGYSTPMLDETRSMADAADAPNDMGGHSQFDDYQGNDIYYDDVYGMFMKREAREQSADEQAEANEVAASGEPALFAPVETLEAKPERRRIGVEISKQSATELKCVVCDDYRSHSVDGYENHLSKTHKMTPTEAGIFFRCDCGNESRSAKHFRIRKPCHGAVVTLCRDEDHGGGPPVRQAKRFKKEPIVEGVDEEATVGRKKKVKRQCKKVKKELIVDDEMSDHEEAAVEGKPIDKPAKKHLRGVKMEPIEDEISDELTECEDTTVAEKEVTVSEEAGDTTVAEKEKITISGETVEITVTEKEKIMVSGEKEGTAAAETEESITVSGEKEDRITVAGEKEDRITVAGENKEKMTVSGEEEEVTVTGKKTRKPVKRRCKIVKEEIMDCNESAVDTEEPTEAAPIPCKRGKQAVIAEGMNEHEEDTVGRVKIDRRVTIQYKKVKREATGDGTTDEDETRRDTVDEDDEGEEREEEKRMIRKKVKREFPASASAIEMKCVECEDFASHQVSSYVHHLKRTHGKTPKQAGVSFRCECGHICRSNSHTIFAKCSIMRISVVRDEEMEQEGHQEGEGREKDQDGEEAVEGEEVEGGNGDETEKNDEYSGPLRCRK